MAVTVLYQSKFEKDVPKIRKEQWQEPTFPCCAVPCLSPLSVAPPQEDFRVDQPRKRLE